MGNAHWRSKNQMPKLFKCNENGSTSKLGSRPQALEAYISVIKIDYGAILYDNAKKSELSKIKYNPKNQL